MTPWNDARSPRRALVSACFVALFAACGPTPPPARTAGTGGGAAGNASASGASSRGPGEQRIVGTLARSPAERARRKRIRIWGKVKRVIAGEHGELPPLRRTSEDGIGDPVTQISNETTFGLSVWFAGKCAHKTEVPARGKVTAVFCPGTYHIAAVVDSEDYLPLVREDQTFEAGVGYLLQFIVKKRPRAHGGPVQ